MSFQTINGKVTILSEGLANQNPSGLRVSVYKGSEVTSDERIWIGSARVKPDGRFSVMVHTESMYSGDLLVKVFNNEQLLKEHIETGGKTDDLDISITAASYDSKIADDTLKSEHADYFLLKGTVYLGEARVAAVPFEEGIWTVVLNKALFRNNIALAATEIDAFGKYEIKIPFRAIYAATTGREFNAFPNLQLSLVKDNTVMSKSDLIELAANEQTVDLFVNDEANFGDFITEFLHTSKAITAVTGLEVPNFDLIEIEGEQSELELIQTTSGIAPTAVANMLVAARQYVVFDADIQHIYALVRKGYRTTADIGQLSGAEIETILTTATDQHVIATSTLVSDTVEKIEAIRTALLGGEQTADGYSLRDMLYAMVSSDAIVDTFLKLYLNNNEEDMAVFWAHAAVAVGNANAKRFQEGLQIMAVVGMQPEMIEYIITQFTLGSVTEYLISQTKTDWTALITTVCNAELKLCVPEGVRGEISQEEYTNTIVINAYSQKITDIVSLIFATDVIKNMLETDDTFMSHFQDPGAVSSFLASNPDFDFRADRIWDVENELPKVAQADLQGLQNLSRLASGNINLIKQMMSAGIKSSSHIVAMPESDFLDLFPTKPENAEAVPAKEVYAKALQIDMNIKQAYIQMQPGNYAEKVTADWDSKTWIREDQPEVSYSYPDLETLFGSMDTCACSDCSSMYSPSAYFTDVMNFIKTKVGNAAYSELNRRRPDLKHIDLSCKNANTAMPYIDLVNEILELNILKDIKAKDAGESALMIPASFQTSATAEELAAYPEHTYKDPADGTYKPYTAYTKVYDKRLNQAVFPNTLPFNLAVEESKVFLKHLGHSREALMQFFKPAGFDSNLNNSSINAYTAAAESLGINTQVADIITETNAAQPWLYYGFDTAGTWYDTLCLDLETLLAKTQTDYKTFLQILTTDFLNPVKVPASGARGFAITSKAGRPSDSCVLEDLMLTYRPASGENINNQRIAFFTKLHRFIRLYRATGWTVYQLDTVLRSLQADNIDVDHFIQIAQAVQWSKSFSIAPEFLAVLWSDIDTAQYINLDTDNGTELPSVYDRLFRNKGIINPVDQNFEDPANISGSIDDNKATISSALSVTEEDIRNIISNLSQSTDIASLSLIYRSLLLYKISGFDSYVALQEDLLSLFDLELTGSNPAAYIASCKEILSYQDWVSKSVFSVEELKFILLSEDPQNEYGASHSAIQSFYENLRADLKKMRGDVNLSLNEPEVHLLREKIKNTAAQQFATAFNLEFTHTHALLLTFLSPTAGGTEYLECFAWNLFLDSTNNITFSDGIPGLIWYFDLYYLHHVFSKISMICTRLKISGEEAMLMQQNKSTLDVLDVNRLRKDPSLAINAEVAGAFIRFNQWFESRDQLRLNASQFISVLKVSSTAISNNSGWKALLSSLVKWDNTALDYLLGDGVSNKGVLGYTFAPAVSVNHDYRHASLLLQINKIMKAVSKLGLSVESTYNTLVPQITTEQSLTVRKAAKAKYETTQWYSIVKPLQDSLRKQQRDALVDYLLANPAIVLNGSTMKLKNENDLFAYLLLDVEMESCMKTSRLRLGLSSLQLFLDRIILSLERHYNTSSTPIGITPIYMNEDNIAQWQSWRKWYRVWEANRKVFLYPENWIEPELRDKKTGLFKELESHLLQDEVTDARVEEGFRTYLEGLNEVARLEPVSAYHQTSYGKDILHVFARTDSDPQRYYYRNREDNEWSEWQRVGVDIKSKYVVPVMWNNKMYLFWLSFQKKKPNFDNSGEPAAFSDRPGAKPSMTTYSGNSWTQLMTNNSITGSGKGLINDDQYDRYNVWNINLNWSQYQDGKWLSHEICKDIMDIDISKILVNGNAKDSIMTAQAAETIYNLTNNGSMGVDDFFTKRIFLFTPYDLTVDTKDGIAFNLAFAPGLNEVATGLHTFLWKGDNSRDPFVLRDSDRGHSIVAPLGTRYSNMKFIQDGKLGAGFKKDSSYDRNHTGYFAYSNMAYYPGGNSIFRSGASIPILNLSPTPFRLTACAATTNQTMFDPLNKRFFYEDENNTYLVEDVSGALTAPFKPTELRKSDAVSLDKVISFAGTNYGGTASMTQSGISNNPSLGQNTAVNNGYKFQTFYHAQAQQLTAALNRGGMDNLLTLSNQSQADTMGFWNNYLPTNKVNNLYPKNTMQFRFEDPYSMYNWELFFHAPMLIAQQLSNNQQFAEAQKWYHYIFNPTTAGNGAQRYWKFQPFFAKAGEPVTTLYDLMISIHNNNPESVAQVKQWEKDPFNPHRIARMRILSYMKNVLMKYLDNLIAWADNLFKRDTIESINEATQLYILAANLLGERPKQLPARVKREDKTFLELSDAGLDALSNAMVAIESFLAPNDAPGVDIYNTSAQVGVTRPKEEVSIQLQTFYFCLPKNDKLLQYWDTLADRLFKIRNCMNIDGATRQLALYEPPIDPALLVRAKAMGLSTETVLDDIYGNGKPFYRFAYMVQKANEVLNDVKALGGAMLSAMEKKDAEALSLLRSVQEYDVLEKVKDIKTQQVEEANRNLDNLRLVQTNTQIRYSFYNSRPFKNSNEQKHLDKMQSAMTFQVVQGVLQTTGGALAAMPMAHAQAVASGVSYGGLQLANVMQAVSSAVGIKVAVDNAKGSMAATIGGYERRRDDWQFQANTAAKELEALEQQILAAEIRLDIAQKELRNHELQMEHNLSVDSYMRSKFSNVELYNWMTSQLATTYFQSYQMAYDMAKQADLCFQSELPAGKYPAAGFIKYGYWDSLKKGLLSGEKLQLDIRRMEATYMESNERELELTKHVSLAVFSPESIIELRQTGTCTVEIPEVLFDLDYPGHYMRRIKSVSLSVPCIAGPYTTINCQLTQGESKFRKSSQVSGSYSDPGNYTAVNSGNMIATSSAQNDSGIFELNFRDERYLPFEGTGAISTWTISFPDTYRQFDYDTISDIILHLKYTARYDGLLKTAAETNITSVFSTLNENNVLHRYFSAKHEFSNNWYAYAKNFESNPYARLQMALKQDQFPFFTQGRSISAKRIHVSLNGKKALTEDYTLRLTYTAATGYKTLAFELDADNNYTSSSLDTIAPILFQNNTKIMQIALEDSEGNTLNATELLDDIMIVLDYVLGTSAPSTQPDDEAQLDIVSKGLNGWWQAAGKGNVVSASSGELSLLKDLSGQGRDFIEKVSYYGLPVMSTQNGIPAISFSNNIFSNGANGDTIGRSDSFTAFYIGSCGFGRGINYFGGNNTFNYFSHYYNNGAVSIIFQQPAPDEGFGIENEFFTKNFLTLSLDQQTSSTLTVYDPSGNVHNSLSTSKSVMRPSNIGLTLGAGAELGYINGDFYELMVYNRVLSQTEIQSVLAYLKNKYPFLTN